MAQKSIAHSALVVTALALGACAQNAARAPAQEDPMARLGPDWQGGVYSKEGQVLFRGVGKGAAGSRRALASLVDNWLMVTDLCASCTKPGGMVAVGRPPTEEAQAKGCVAPTDRRITKQLAFCMAQKAKETGTHTLGPGHELHRMENSSKDMMACIAAQEKMPAEAKARWQEILETLAARATPEPTMPTGEMMGCP